MKNTIEYKGISMNQYCLYLLTKNDTEATA